MAERQEDCKTCRFLDADFFTHEHICRHHAPREANRHNSVSPVIWPRINLGHDWCGDWKPMDGV